MFGKSINISLNSFGFIHYTLRLKSWQLKLKESSLKSGGAFSLMIKQIKTL